MTTIYANKEANRGLKARWPELEERVHRWVLEQRPARRGSSTVQLRLHNLLLTKEMNINDFADGPASLSEHGQQTSKPRSQFLWVYWKAGNWTQLVTGSYYQHGRGLFLVLGFVKYISATYMFFSSSWRILWPVRLIVWKIRYLEHCCAWAA